MGNKNKLSVIASVLVLNALWLNGVHTVQATEFRVFKGHLKVSIPDQQDRDSLLMQYRSKTRDVLRIGLSGMSMTNAATRQVTRLDDRIARLASHADRDGYWVASFEYGGLQITNDNYRLEGLITEFMAGSHQTRQFRIYLREEAGQRPKDSTINWGPGLY